MNYFGEKRRSRRQKNNRKTAEGQIEEQEKNNRKTTAFWEYEDDAEDQEVFIMIKEAIVKIVNKEDLTYDEA